MPKLKTLRAAAKRFKKTASGKSAKRKRHLGEEAIVTSADAKNVERMLPYAK